MNNAALFLIFNRPDTTVQVFETIRQARPPRLYIAADGPRSNKPGETGRVEGTRRVVLDNIDWECDVHTLLRETNLGCRQTVSEAIDWFFENEEQGIILEDDCVPHPSFFPFCEALLEKYRDDERVMMISGTNYLLQLNVPESYVFSRYFAIWGWASWRRAWQKYDIDMTNWPQLKAQKQLNYIFSQPYMQTYLNNMFDVAYYRQIDTWDIQWFYSCLFNNGLSIVPKVNLISNIGITGTHISSDKSSNFLPVFPLEVENIEHPSFVFANSMYDINFFEQKIKRPLVNRIKNKLASLKHKLISGSNSA
jgi:hypothetical protein